MTARIEQTIDGHSFEIDTVDGSIFTYAAFTPSNQRIARGQAPDIDSAFAFCERAIQRRGGTIARYDEIKRVIAAHNPDLPLSAVGSLADDVVQTLLGG